MEIYMFTVISFTVGAVGAVAYKVLDRMTVGKRRKYTTVTNKLRKIKKFEQHFNDSFKNDKIF